MSFSLYKYTYYKGLEAKFCNGLEVQCWVGTDWSLCLNMGWLCRNNSGLYYGFHVSIFFFFLTSPSFPAVFFMLFYFYVIGCVLKMLCFCKRRVGKQNLNFSNILNCMSVPSAISYWYNCEIDMQSKVGFCLLGLQCEINAGGRIFTFHCDYIMLNVKVFQNDTTTLNFIW